MQLVEGSLPGTHSVQFVEGSLSGTHSVRSVRIKWSLQGLDITNQY